MCRALPIHNSDFRAGFAGGCGSLRVIEPIDDFAHGISRQPARIHLQRDGPIVRAFDSGSSADLETEIVEPRRPNSVRRRCEYGGGHFEGRGGQLGIRLAVPAETITVTYHQPKIALLFFLSWSTCWF